MSNVRFRNTDFVDNPIGYDRPIYGNYVIGLTPSVSLTPTSTPSITPTPSSSPIASLTPTPTPSATPLPNPSDIQGLFWWYDASYTSGMITAGTQSNILVEELEGRQVDGSLYPVVNLGVNAPKLDIDALGYYLTFSGGTERLGLTIESPETLSAMTKFLVFTKDSSISNEEMMVEIGTNFRSHYYFTNYGNSETFHAFDYPGPRFTGMYSWPKYPNYLNWTYMTEPLPYNFDAELNEITYNLGPSDVWGPVDMGQLTIGARLNGGNPSNYKFREFILYDRELKVAEINQVVNYLKTKWNYSIW